MIKTVGRPFGRAMHFDCHTCPGVEQPFSRFCAEEFAAELAAAHVDHINFTARCNMGFSYYNTKVGKKYPGLGERDILQETLDACHKRGIGVSAYINVALNHELAADRKDWLRIFSGGRIHREDKKDNFFREMCYNSEYRQYLIREVRELCAYDVDGIFLDCVTTRKCYCEHCMREMRSRGVNVEDPDAVYAYALTVQRELCRELREVIDACGKPLKVYTSGAPWREEFVTHVEIECLVTGIWGYDSFDPMAAYTRTIAQDRVFMSGRFQSMWGDFGGIKSLPSMQNDLYDAMMNGFAISFGDHLHPVDGLEREVIRRVGAVMAEHMQYERFVKGAEPVCEVGVLMRNNPRNGTPALYGISRMLGELKIGYNVYRTIDASDPFAACKLLIVCEELHADEAYYEKMRAFAARGGKFLFVGEGLDVGQRAGLLTDVAELAADESDNAYFTFPEGGMRWAMYAPSRRFVNKSGTELARYVDKTFNFIWDGRQSYFYRPQGEETRYSAAVVGACCGVCCFDVFAAYSEAFMQEHKLLVARMLELLLPERVLRVENAPAFARVSLTKGDHTVLHVKATHPEIRVGKGVVEEHHLMPSATVSVAGEFRVLRLPECLPVESRTENGRTVFETGDVLGYRAFLLQESKV